MPEFQAPTGTFDVLPPQSARYERLIALYAQHVERAGYGLVVSPMFEDVAVFTRVGESTDVVRKEMYDFEDKGGRRIALRPEGTASVVRAFVEHHPLPPFKAWYAAPNFRYERPQKGRYRQHHQLGLEAIGSADPDVDVEVIALAWDLYAQLGIGRIRLDLTSLGDEKCRPAYRQLLLDFLADKELCDEHKDTYTANPLRVLDCKKPACVAATQDAPAQLDHLCEECGAHFARVTQGLEVLGVPYTLNRRLVRGLDYYTRTTFSFVAESLDSAQNEAGGGGRYDRLVEMLGGPATPAIGFGLGIERILLVCDAEGVFPAPDSTIDVFIVDTTDGTPARDISVELRRAGIKADRAFDGGSFKSQMKRALRSSARLAIVVEADGIQLRTLQDKGEPETLERATLVDHVRKRLH
ncbi:MAG: histidyl-tRNA synthetase [Actinomycetota bacterium]|nr:histidyl-tRNA synthetase [Actinomycetota bacterium]